MVNKTPQEIFLQNSFLLENIQGGIVYSEFEPPFHIRYSTEGMAKLSGYTVNELNNMLQKDIVHEDDAAALFADVARQFAMGDTFSVEYRLKRKDGSYVYVLDRAKHVLHDDGKKYIHCLLTDISELKEMERDLALKEQKYRLAIQQSGNVILEFNLTSDTLTFSENYKLIFGCDAPIGSLREVLKNDWAADAFKQPLADLFERVYNEHSTCSIEFLLCTNDNKQIWSSLHLIPFMENEQLYSIIGCLENIDKAKHVIEHLTELTLKDSLTGVLNRYGIENHIKNQLKATYNSNTNALIILDIDYFKSINDKNGHDFGDEVLIELSQTVSALLPNQAMLGRLGGDEFLIFVSFQNGTASLHELAQSVVNGVSEHFKSGEQPVTISLGAAWLTPTCNTFKMLYRNADSALYQTKKNGRNGYSIF